jgi:uncharacterized membrane protein YkvA (DUF1232 family)
MAKRERLEQDDQEQRVREGFWPKIAAIAASVPFAEQALAAWYCAFDRETPAAVRYTLVGALAYFILPFDALPDMLPLFGFADDASLLSAALLAVGSSVTDAHREAAREALTRIKSPA